MSFTLNTYVKDIDTQEPLSGATVYISDRNGNYVPVNGVPAVGRVADADGKFILPIANDDAYITARYLGYEAISHPADDYRNDVIYLAKKAVKPSKEIIVRAKKLKPKQTVKTYKKEKKRTAWGVFAAIGAAVVLLSIAIYKLTK